MYAKFFFPRIISLLLNKWSERDLFLNRQVQTARSISQAMPKLTLLSSHGAPWSCVFALLDSPVFEVCYTSYILC